MIGDKQQFTIFTDTQPIHYLEFKHRRNKPLVPHPPWKLRNVSAWKNEQPNRELHKYLMNKWRLKSSAETLLRPMKSTTNTAGHPKSTTPFTSPTDLPVHFYHNLSLSFKYPYLTNLMEHNESKQRSWRQNFGCTQFSRHTCFPMTVENLYLHIRTSLR